MQLYSCNCVTVLGAAEWPKLRAHQLHIYGASEPDGQTDCAYFVRCLLDLVPVAFNECFRVPVGLRLSEPCSMPGQLHS
jgi:hypothetical protein